MFRKIIVNLLLNGLALYGTVTMLEFISIQGGFVTYVWAGLILGLLNALVKPVLKVISFPLKFVTMGLSLLVINIIIFYLADISMEQLFGLEYDIVMETDLVSYAKVGILFGVINWAEHLIIR